MALTPKELDFYYTESNRIEDDDRIRRSLRPLHCCGQDSVDR